MSLFTYKMMKNLLLLLSFILISPSSLALNFNSTALQLHCPTRGLVEVTLHVYGHVSELWQGHYEVGAGHRQDNGVEVVSFSNGDRLIHRSRSGEFLYRYAGKGTLQRCQKLSESPLHAQTLAYHH
ncbi:hypothetical protein [Kluyvera georgiana]